MFSTLYQNFTGNSLEYHQNASGLHQNVTIISPEPQLSLPTRRPQESESPLCCERAPPIRKVAIFAMTSPRSMSSEALLSPARNLSLNSKSPIDLWAKPLSSITRLCFQHLCLPFRPLPYLIWPITRRNSTGLSDPTLPRLPPTLLPFQKQSPGRRRSIRVPRVWNPGSQFGSSHSFAA